MPLTCLGRGEGGAGGENSGLPDTDGSEGQNPRHLFEVVLVVHFVLRHDLAVGQPQVVAGRPSAVELHVGGPTPGCKHTLSSGR